jgi:hypothetical protein
LTITVKTIFSHEKLQLEFYTSKTKIKELFVKQPKDSHLIASNE